MKKITWVIISTIFIFLLSSSLSKCMSAKETTMPNAKRELTISQEFEFGLKTIEELKKKTYDRKIELDFLEVYNAILLDFDISRIENSYILFREKYQNDSLSSYFILLGYIYNYFVVQLEPDSAGKIILSAKLSYDATENIYIPIFDYWHSRPIHLQCDTSGLNDFINKGDKLFSDYSTFHLLLTSELINIGENVNILERISKIKFKYRTDIIRYYEALYYASFTNQQKRAISKLNQALDNTKIDPYFFQIGIVGHLLSFGKLKDAKKKFSSYKGPKDYYYYISKGLIEQASEEYNSALLSFKMAYECNSFPYQYEYYFTFSDALMRFENFTPFFNDDRFNSYYWYWLCKIEYLLEYKKQKEDACKLYQSLDDCLKKQILAEMRMARPDNPYFSVCN